MAKKQDDKLPEDGENKPKKKGLFSFLHRKSKSKSEQGDVSEISSASDDELLDKNKPARKK